jgi:hypothetical protein
MSRQNTEEDLTAAQINRIREFVNSRFGAGTWERVNYGQLHAMLRAAGSGSSASAVNLNARDKRTATSLAGQIASASR